jgi:enhancing lycopene biosynthesis protein 2
MARKKRIGVLLSGCGHRDGSEIHEATLTLLALDGEKAEAVCLAPKGPQRFVRDHVSGAAKREKRDMFVEAARIARGQIQDVARVDADDLDGLILPGGQGAALNLSTFLVDGPFGTVRRDVTEIIKAMLREAKPIGAICIAPATLACILKKAKVRARLTLGADPRMAATIEAMGHAHKNCEPSECLIDRGNRIVTTPAYMNATSIGEIWEGIRKLVHEVVKMA